MSVFRRGVRVARGAAVDELPSDDLMVSILTKQIKQLLDKITLKTILQITINFFILILISHS